MISSTEIPIWKKKKIIFFTIQFGIVLRLQTNGKNTTLKTTVPR